MPLDFLTQYFPPAEIIALGAFLVSLLSVIYTRRQYEEARKARLSAIKEGRRIHRLEVFRLMLEFCAFCGRYYTRYLMKSVVGTRDLIAELESFSWQIEQYGPLEMPKVEAEVKTLESMAWRLQRSLDRLGRQSSVIEIGIGSEADENAVHELVDAFAAKRRALRDVFKPYLSDV